MTNINTTLETSRGDLKTDNPPPQSTARVIVLHLCQCQVPSLRHAVSAFRADFKSLCCRRDYHFGL